MDANKFWDAGEFFTRDGTDIQILKESVDRRGGNLAPFRCVFAPHNGWCAVGDDDDMMLGRCEHVHLERAIEWITRHSGIAEAMRVVALRKDVMSKAVRPHVRQMEMKL